jgi:hypothetical protein
MMNGDNDDDDDDDDDDDEDLIILFSGKLNILRIYCSIGNCC